eukprot:scaffold4394_cov113-Isochrysis_galbana.AAC.13
MPPGSTSPSVPAACTPGAFPPAIHSWKGVRGVKAEARQRAGSSRERGRPGDELNGCLAAGAALGFQLGLGR